MPTNAQQLNIVIQYMYLIKYMYIASNLIKYMYMVSNFNKYLYISFKPPSVDVFGINPYWEHLCGVKSHLVHAFDVKLIKYQSSFGACI